MEKEKHLTILDKHIKWLKSDNGKKHLDNFRKKQEIKIKRYEYFKKWLEENDFDKLIYRLVFEHDDNYREKCYHNGYEPYPNNKLQFIIDYIIHNFEPIDVKDKRLKSDFPTNVWKFNDYYLQMIFGQGTMINLYNKKDMRCILSI